MLSGDKAKLAVERYLSGSNKGEAWGMLRRSRRVPIFIETRSTGSKIFLDKKSKTL